MEKICGGDSSLAGSATHNNGCIKRKHAGREFGGGIGMRQAATQRSPVADGRMGDMRRRLGQERRMRADLGRIKKIDMACQRANTENTVPDGDPTQFGELA